MSLKYEPSSEQIHIAAKEFSLAARRLTPLSSEYGTARIRQSRPDSGLGFQVKQLDRLRVGLCSSGEGHKTRRCRRVTYPESYITKYSTYTKINPFKLFPVRSEAV